MERRRRCADAARAGQHCGLTIPNLRLIGNTAAKPSAAIELNETDDGLPNQQITVDTVYIGGFTIDTDPGTHFVNGIAWAGTGVNNAEIRLLGVQINDCSISSRCIAARSGCI